MKTRINKKAILFIVILIIVIAGVVIALNSIHKCWYAPADVSEYVKETSESVSDTDSSSSSSPKVKLAENPIDFKSLRKENKEIFAWLRVPDTNIDYPLLQSQERDDYYLSRDIYGNNNFSGSLYIECCNSIDLDDRVTVIYGHNMYDGSMFANLHKFRDTAFFKKHKKFYIYTPGSKLTYQVVSAYEFDSRHLMNTNNYFANDKDFEDYLEFIQNPRSLSANVREKLDHELTIEDKIVTLSTCLDYGDGRYLLQGVLIKNEPTR